MPLASHLHYTLGQVRDAHAGTPESRLIFLKGRRFEAIRPGVFMRPLEEMQEALRLREMHNHRTRSNSVFKPTPLPGTA